MDKALHAPRGPPAALDNPEVAVVVTAIADGQDAMVQEGGAAVLVRVGAVLVQVEGGLAGVDRNGNGANIGNSIPKRVNLKASTMSLLDYKLISIFILLDNWIVNS